MSRLHPVHLKPLYERGIRYLHRPLVHTQHMGGGKYEKFYGYTGKKLNQGQILQVRNVVFEPTDNPRIDNVQKALNQIEAAFFWNKPAIISTHRVNFCGHIERENRDNGLEQLNFLLKSIVRKWPDVEFMDTDELGSLMDQNIGN